MTGLGDFVKSRRAEMGMNQKELAQRSGLSCAYLSQIENGMRKWPRIYVPALAEALDVSEVDLAIAAGMLSPDAKGEATT